MFTFNFLLLVVLRFKILTRIVVHFKSGDAVMEMIPWAFPGTCPGPRSKERHLDTEGQRSFQYK